MLRRLATVQAIHPTFKTILGFIKKGINIFIISKDKYFDFINRIIVWQAKLAALFHGKKIKNNIGSIYCRR